MRSFDRDWKKLDCILVSSACHSAFSQTIVSLLSRTTSDHSPLLCSFDPCCPQGHGAFQFQQMWVRRPDFLEVVCQSWHQPTLGYNMFTFHQKLKHLKCALSVWNKSVFGNVFHNVEVAEECVKQCELTFDAYGFSTNLIALNKAHVELLHHLAKEEVFWK